VTAKAVSQVAAASFAAAADLNGRFFVPKVGIIISPFMLFLQALTTHF
jgi:hypothetical protein